jgi:flavorubredoxin
MKKALEIFRQGDHAWQVIARDPEKQGHLIDTNEYLVTSDGQTLLTDPGGIEIFPAVFSAVCEVIDPRTISALFASHQDPDIISSLSLWLSLKPELKCHTSWLWCSFIPHFGGQPDTFVPIPDEGTTLTVGSKTLEAVPAHYLHSSGNFHLYDPVARVYFSGDVGAALLPGDHTDIFVTDFDAHIRHAQGFHQRWMGSKDAKRAWCERVSGMAIDQLCPQHGAIYRGADVARFINWFDELEVGVLRGARRAEAVAA